MAEKAEIRLRICQNQFRASSLEVNGKALLHRRLKIEYGVEDSYKDGTLFVEIPLSVVDSMEFFRIGRDGEEIEDKE
jgi:hypothetical protein